MPFMLQYYASYNPGIKDSGISFQVTCRGSYTFDYTWVVQNYFSICSCIIIHRIIHLLKSHSFSLLFYYCSASCFLLSVENKVEYLNLDLYIFFPQCETWQILREKWEKSMSLRSLFKTMHNKVGKMQVFFTIV